MSHIKNQILSMCEDYENGFSIFEIANFYGYTANFVDEVLTKYCDSYYEEEVMKSLGVTNHEGSKLSGTL